MLRLVTLAAAAVFAHGLWLTQPWAHPAWTSQGWERFLTAMCATAVLTLGAHKYWFYGVILVLACSLGVMPVLGLGFVLLGGLNLGSWLFHQKDDRLNLLAGFAIYVWIFSLIASLPVNTVWLWGVLLAAPIAAERRLVLPLPQLSLPVAMPLVANFLLALKPEVSADGLAMHFQIVQWVKDHARFPFDVGTHLWAVNPMAGDWALAIANLFGGEPAARLLNLVWLLVLVSFVHGALRRRLEDKGAALVTGIFAATPLLQLTSTSMFIENFWTAMIVGALFAIDQGEIVLAATLAGASGASKLLGLVPAPILAGFGLFRKPQRKTVLLGVLVFLAIAIVPYGRAYWMTGNPVFHYSNAFFKSPLMPPVDFVDLRYPARLTWHTLYDITFHTDWFVESEPGTAGYQWLWFLPLALVAVRRASALERAALVMAVFVVVLVFSRQASLRYVELFMPLLTIAAAPALAELASWQWAAWLALAVFGLNLFQAPGASGYHRDFALLPGERNAYVARMAPARQLVEVMNRVAPGAPVAFLVGDEIAGLRGPAWAASWHSQRYSDKLAVTHSVEGYIALMREFGVAYIVAPREGHWRYIAGSAMALFVESATDVLATAGDLQLVKLRVEARAPVWAAVGSGTYDDADARIVYGGAWYLDQSFAQPASRTVSYSSGADAAVRFAFHGTRVVYYFTKAFNRGQASVEIDGQLKGIVDLYSQQAEWQAHVSYELPPGDHTIVIRHAGPAQTFIDLDQFVVE